MYKYTLKWEVEDTLEAEDREEAVRAFIELIRSGEYGPIDWEVMVVDARAVAEGPDADAH